MISDSLWRTHLGATPDVIGRTIHLNGRPFTIVGVAARAFHGYTIDVQHVWVPITAYPDGDDLRRVALRGRQWLMGIGRLRGDVTIDEARAEMARIARDLEREHPDDNRRRSVQPSVGPSALSRGGATSNNGIPLTGEVGTRGKTTFMLPSSIQFHRHTHIVAQEVDAQVPQRFGHAVRGLGRDARAEQTGERSANAEGRRRLLPAARPVAAEEVLARAAK